MVNLNFILTHGLEDVEVEAAVVEDIGTFMTSGDDNFEVVIIKEEGTNSIVSKWHRATCLANWEDTFFENR